MERIEFCKGSYCAKLTVNVEGKKPIVLISKTPTLILEIDKPVVDFSHEMRAPIDLEFPFSIKGIEFVSGFWHYSSGTGGNKVDCPMPGTYPVVAAPDVEPGDPEVTDLYWERNHLYCHFDKIGGYTNNTGVCNYKVLGKDSYKFFDRQGVLYLGEGNLTYTVECDACCADNEIICDSPRFPGYTCYQLPPAADRILKGRNDIKRYWRR
jgi:hypothetical protein